MARGGGSRSAQPPDERGAPPAGVAAPEYAAQVAATTRHSDLRLWWLKWRWYQRGALPWNRLLLHREFARRRAFAKWPLNGEVLELLRSGRLEIGEGTLLERGVWLTGGDDGRIRIGEGVFLNQGVMVAATDLVEIGDHCMAANGCVITDADHRFDDPTRPITWQGFQSRGPTRLGDNVWLGANVVVTSGVTIGSRAVIGAGSVVTADVPPASIAAGAPARVIRPIEFRGGEQADGAGAAAG